MGASAVMAMLKFSLSEDTWHCDKPRHTPLCQGKHPVTFDINSPKRRNFFMEKMLVCSHRRGRWFESSTAHHQWLRECVRASARSVGIPRLVRNPDLIQAIIFQISSLRFTISPKGGMGPTTFSEPLRTTPWFAKPPPMLRLPVPSTNEPEQRIVVIAVNPNLIGEQRSHAAASTAAMAPAATLRHTARDASSVL
jgi:hypothetical protein